MHKLECVICNSEFSSKKSTAHYCGPTCRHKAWRAEKNKPTGNSERNCASCGNLFFSKRVSHMYCSSTCAKKSPGQYDYLKRKKESDPVFKEKRRTLNYRWTLNKPQNALWGRAKRSAKMRGIPFNISPADIIFPADMVCPVLGIKLEFKVPSDTNPCPSPFSPSLDRIDNNIGYTKDNIRVISDRANRLKNNGTLEEFEMIVEYMRGKRA